MNWDWRKRAVALAIADGVNVSALVLLNTVIGLVFVVAYNPTAILDNDTVSILDMYFTTTNILLVGVFQIFGSFATRINTDPEKASKMKTVCCIFAIILIIFGVLLALILLPINLIGLAITSIFRGFALLFGAQMVTKEYQDELNEGVAAAC